MIAGLQVLAAVVDGKGAASKTCRQFEPIPQLLENIRVRAYGAEDAATVKEAVAEGEARLGDTGRLLIRKSGTESVIRVMAEGEDAGLISSVVGDIAQAIKRVDAGH